MNFARGTFKSRDEQLDALFGMVAATGPFTRGNGAQGAFAAGEVRGTALFLRAGDQVSNLVVHLSTPGAGAAGSVFALLYDANGNLEAQSADVQAQFAGAAGLTALPFTAPYLVPTDGLYYPAIFNKTAFGTTAWQISGNFLAGMGGSLAGKMFAVALAGQAAIPNPIVWAATVSAFWFGLS